MRPMPRLETMPWAVATSYSPSVVPPQMIPRLASTAPPNQKATAAPPTKKPMESIMGLLYRPKLTPGMGRVSNMAGITPSTSRATLHAPASAMEPKSLTPVAPPAWLARNVSAAATPMGYSRLDSSTRRLRMSAVHTRPSRVPASATSSISTQLTLSACPSIQMPGMVKARPPATMEPADMMICVTFASFRLLWPKARSSTSAVMEVKMVGQGRAPILRAV